MNPEFAAMCTLVAMLMAGITITLVLRGPLGRAMARRIEGRYGSNADDSARVAELEQRVAELEQGQAHLAELEERLDFAERVLAAGSEDRARQGGLPRPLVTPNGR